MTMNYFRRTEDLMMQKRKMTIRWDIALLLVLSMGLGFGAAFLIYHAQPSQHAEVEPSLKMVRDHSYKFTRPIRYFDLTQPSGHLDAIQAQLQALIRTDRENGILYQASVYIRDLETGEWTSVNEEEGYHPGSLIKVPMLIYYLKEAEREPGILNRTLTLPPGVEGVPSQTFRGTEVQEGKAYTVRELLKFMVSYSDNRATMLLNGSCDVPRFKKIFTDLGLQEPDVTDTNYAMTIRDYSVFMRVLYNATYLNAEHSDFALDLLTQSSFQIGLQSRLPGGVTSARKFGEYMHDRKRELHESGIVYCNKKPYLITVMTKGYNSQTLAEFIGTVSDMVYRVFCS
jgi:beta-lactamase class A